MKQNLRSTMLSKLTPVPFQKGDDGELTFLKAVSHLIGGVAAMLITNPVSAFVSPTAWVFFFITLWVVVSVALQVLPRKSVLFGLNDDNGKYISYYGRIPSSREAAKRILALPKEDQSAFPNNIFDTLRLPLSDGQSEKVRGEILITLHAIETRDAQRVELSKAGYDVSDVVNELQRAQQYINVETETLREFNA